MKDMKTKKMMSGKMKSTIELTIMALPCAIVFIMLKYFPMGGLLMAFKKYRITSKGFIQSLLSSEFVGFDNFKFLFQTEDVLIAVRNTLLYNTLWIVIGLVISVTFAIMLNEITNKRLAKLYQTAMFFPHFLSWVVVASFVFAFLSHERGFINNIIAAGGNEKIMWYLDRKYWPYILTIMHIWKATGYSSVVYLAAICGIDKTFYEAAMIDGATKLQKIRYITIPMLTPMMSILTIMSIGKIFSADFGLFYNVPQAASSGALKPVIDVVDTYVYNTMLNLNDFGMSTAAGLTQSVVGLVMIIGANSIVKYFNEENSMF